jgi:hypothetical protein
VLAGIVVGGAIIFEAEKYSKRVQQAAKWAVIIAVVVESCCTISLFIIDECISSAQQSEIIRLSRQIAGRMPEAEQFKLIAEELKGKKGSVPLLTVLPTNDPEAEQFAQWIYLSLFDIADKITVSEPISVDSPLGAFTTGTMLYSVDAKSDPIASAFRRAKLASIFDIAALGKTPFGLPKDRDTLVVGRRSAPAPFGMH